MATLRILQYELTVLVFSWQFKSLPGTRPPPPHLRGPNSLIFMQFSAKIINKHTPQPPGKILDQPLQIQVSVKLEVH